MALFPQSGYCASCRRERPSRHCWRPGLPPGTRSPRPAQPLGHQPQFGGEFDGGVRRRVRLAEACLGQQPAAGPVGLQVHPAPRCGPAAGKAGRSSRTGAWAQGCRSRSGSGTRRAPPACAARRPGSRRGSAGPCPLPCAAAGRRRGGTASGPSRRTVTGSSRPLSTRCSTESGRGLDRCPEIVGETPHRADAVRLRRCVDEPVHGRLRDPGAASKAAAGQDVCGQGVPALELLRPRRGRRRRPLQTGVPGRA